MRIFIILFLAGEGFAAWGPEEALSNYKLEDLKAGILELTDTHYVQLNFDLSLCHIFVWLRTFVIIV